MIGEFAPDTIQITALAPAKHCVDQILVRGRWAGGSMGVPLAQLQPTDTDKATAEAIAD